MTNNKSVLIVAAHPDDEVIGCGGTAAIHARNGDIVHVLIVAEGATSRSDDRENIDLAATLSELKKAGRTAAEILGLQSPMFLSLPDNRLDNIALLEITQKIETVIAEIAPKIVYTHHGGDLNIDHRTVHQAVITACRPQPDGAIQKVLTFETVSSTEWATPATGTEFRPNVFVDISPVLDAKHRALKAYKMEMRSFPHARSIENIDALAKFRGASVGVTSAESFMLVREVIS